MIVYSSLYERCLPIFRVHEGIRHIDFILTEVHVVVKARIAIGGQVIGSKQAFNWIFREIFSIIVGILNYKVKFKKGRDSCYLRGVCTLLRKIVCNIKVSLITVSYCKLNKLSCLRGKASLDFITKTLRTLIARPQTKIVRTVWGKT